MRTQLSQALYERWQSMKRKLPIIVFAAFACYGLYWLDSVKHRFDEEKAAPILVDQEFKDRLAVEFRQKGGDEPTWDDIQEFIAVSQYTTDSDFINKVAARISRVVDVKERVAEANFRGCIADNAAAAESAKTATAAIAKADTTDVTPVTIKPQGPPVATAELDCAETYLGSNQDAYREAQNRIANVYRYIKQIDLKKIRTNLDEEKRQSNNTSNGEPPRKKGYLESALQPTLNDQSGLHIIYQTLRVSLVVLIIFAFISFVVLLLARLMLNDGVKTVTEQATSFIGPGKGSVLPVAKGAALSIAAFGLGAAAVGGVPSSSADNLAAVHEPSSVVKSSKPGGGAKGSDGSSAGRGGAPYDYNNTQYAYNNSGDDYSSSQDNSVTNYPTTTPVVKEFREVSVVPASGASKGGAGGLDAEVASSLKSHLESLSKFNQELLVKLGQIVQPPAKDDVKVANHVQQNKEDKPLLIKDAANGPISTSITTLKEDLTSIKNATTTALDDVQTTSIDEPDKPKERSLLAKLLRGPDKYFVSKRSVEQLEKIRKGRDDGNQAEIQKLTAEAKKDPLKKPDADKRIAELEWKSSADRLILEAVKSQYLSGGKPMEAAKFYDEIYRILDRLLTTSTPPAQRSADTLQRLQYWRDTILTYTRIG